MKMIINMTIKEANAEMAPFLPEEYRSPQKKVILSSMIAPRSGQALRELTFLTV